MSITVVSFSRLVWVLAALGASGASSAQENLLAKYACTACHAADRKMVGPAWKDVAAKYAGGGKSAEALAQSIKKGGSGNWGAIPMPAQATVPDADTLALARWILSTKH